MGLSKLVIPLNFKENKQINKITNTCNGSCLVQIPKVVNVMRTQALVGLSKFV